jgi:hypothetical protein
MMYIDRFIIQQRAKRIEFRMNSLNVHRLMLSRCHLLHHLLLPLLLSIPPPNILRLG